jgi:hypothetical protein
MRRPRVQGCEEHGTWLGEGVRKISRKRLHNFSARAEAVPHLKRECLGRRILVG